MKKFLSILLILTLMGSGEAFAGSFSSSSRSSFSSSRSTSSSSSVRPSSSSSFSSSNKSTFGSATTKSVGVSSTYSASVPSRSTTSSFTKTGTSSFSTTPTRTYSTVNRTYISVPGYQPRYYGYSSGGFSAGLATGILLDHYTSPYAYYPSFHTYGAYTPVITDYSEDGYQEASFSWDNGDLVVLKTYQKVDDLTRTDEGVTITLNGKDTAIAHGKQSWGPYYSNLVRVQIDDNIISSYYDWSGDGFMMAVTIFFMIFVLVLAGCFGYVSYQKYKEDKVRTAEEGSTRNKW